MKDVAIPQTLIPLDRGGALKYCGEYSNGEIIPGWSVCVNQHPHRAVLEGVCLRLESCSCSWGAALPLLKEQTSNWAANILRDLFF